MARRRFFVESVRAGRAELSGEAAQHLRRVLRAEPGQRFEISDNQSVYLAEIEGFQRDLVLFRLLARIETEPPPLRLILLAALIKFDRFEWLVEKATELGVEAIVPVEAERSEKGLDRAAGKRLERWRRIALESSQQARRARLPQITVSTSFAQALQTPAAGRYFLEEERGAPPLLSVLPEAVGRSPADTVCLLVGPEGGWVDEERRAAAAGGWQAASLGPQILRAETAAIAALAILTAAWYAGSNSEHGGADGL
jgi:16S rRNA (uracil1498-N3)-methyltransferase